MDHEEEVLDGLSITLEDSLDLEERFESTIHLVGRLTTDNEPSYIVVKEVLRSAWNKMGIVRISKAKDNIYAITVGEEAVVKKLLDGNPWFIRAIYWVQVHGILRTFCTSKNARFLGSKIGAILEVEDPVEAGFCGFLRMRVDFDASKPLLTCFSVPCSKLGSYTIRLRYEGLGSFVTSVVVWAILVAAFALHHLFHLGKVVSAQTCERHVC